MGIFMYCFIMEAPFLKRVSKTPELEKGPGADEKYFFQINRIASILPLQKSNGVIMHAPVLFCINYSN